MVAISDLKKYSGVYWIWIEAFVILNYSVLVLDIYLAHSANEFHRSAEYIPLYFSLIAPAILIAGLIGREKQGWIAAWRDLGYFVGWLSVLIGLAGVIWHLGSQFFYEKTLRSLTYAAPFSAPLAYAGIGLLLILNRMVDVDSDEWTHWLLLLTAGGYFGNFILSLTDHAADGFFMAIEWLPVISGAFAASFLVVPLFMRVQRPYLRVCAAVLLFQAVVGLLGFFLHARQNMHSGSILSLQNMINGAPPLAPLLFPNLVPLGLIALWVLNRRTPVE